MKDILFFLKLFKPYQGTLLLGVFLALLTALASVSLLTLAGWFITAAAIAGLQAPDGVAITFNFMQPAAEIRALAIIRTFGRYAERVISHQATFSVLAEIRCWFFGRLIPLAPGQLSMQRSADLLSGITQDIDALDSIYLRLCIPIIIAVIAGLAAVCFFSVYSVWLAVLLLFTIIVAAVMIPWVFYCLGKPAAKKIVEQQTDFKIQQIDMLQGMADLTVFNAYQHYRKEILLLSENMIETQTKNNQLTALSTAITGFVAQTTLLLIIVGGSMLYQQQIISGPVLVMLSFVVLAVFELIMPMASSLQMLTTTQTSATRIRHIAHLPPLIQIPEKPCKVAKSGELKITNLNFRYSNHASRAVKNINLTITPGSRIAIVGASGSGKSTLLHLLMRYFDPQQGSIKYASVDYQNYATDELMSVFSMLSQRTHLFADTIRQNLLIAKPDATDKEIHQAIDTAGLKRYIQQLPDGLDTWVGESGAKVSSGEARRIALARVYLKNAPILLLDEPTEGLDRETEDDVFNALEIIARDKTLIMVTHRLTGLRLVEKVYRMNEGHLTLNNTS